MPITTLASSFARGREHIQRLNRKREEKQKRVENPRSAGSVLYIVVWRGFPVRFLDLPGKVAYEIVTRADATTFATEDEAAHAAVKNLVPDFCVHML